jgi:rubrerythrin
MPHFDAYGGDEWICQVCGRVQDSRVESVWRPDITGHKGAGNVCPKCL